MRGRSVTRVRFGDATVATGIPLGGLPPSDAPADITIAAGVLPPAGDLLQQWSADDGSTWLAIHRAPNGYRVSMEGLACFMSADGRDIAVDARPGAGDDMVTHLLLHQVLPLALSRTGRFVLHACAVETDSGTVAFLGQSGSGKSSLAAACCRRGAALVADDALALDVHGETVRAWPTADGVRLWDDMRVAAGPVDVRSHAGGKLHAAVTLARDPSRLSRIYRLETSRDGSSTTGPLSPAGARIEMLSHLFRIDVTDRDESRRLFDAAHAAASRVTARELIYPDGLEFLDAAVDAVFGDLS